MDFRPAPDDFPGFPMPASVPDGLRLELSRAPLLDGAERAFDDWMATLHERYQECLESIGPQRAAFEATFTHTEADGSVWMYHLSLVGEPDPDVDLDSPIAQAHLEHAKRTKERGWEELAPQFMLTPTHIADQLQRWGQTGRE